MSPYERAWIFFLLAGGMAASDFRIYPKINRKELFIYGLAALPFLYLGFLFMFDLSGLNLTDLLKLVFGKPAMWIGSLMKQS